MLARMQWRIAIPYTLLIGACLLGLSAYLATLLSQAQVDALRSRLAAEARLVGEAVTPPLLAAGPNGLTPEQASALQALITRLSRRADARITIVDRQGMALAHSQADPAQ